MESTDQYNFSIFSPRNHHGKKNRNVILSMLFIWAVAVFGFQFLLRAIEKPTPEKSLVMFESTWPSVRAGEVNDADYKTFLNSLVLVKGKGSVKPADQLLLSEAISCITFSVVPDSIGNLLKDKTTELKNLKEQLISSTEQDYLDIKLKITDINRTLNTLSLPYSGFSAGSLESTILIGSLTAQYPGSFSDDAYSRLPDIMKLYLTHNQSVLTDTTFLGFPFHYFYTAVFLLILFIGLCIVYNILVEGRLVKDGISE